MTELLNNLSVSVSYITEMLLACLVFILPLKKRSRFPLRVALSILAYEIAFYFVLNYSPFQTLLTGENTLILEGAIGFIVCFLLVSFPLILFCCPVSISDVMTCAACAYAMQHFTHSLYSLVYSMWERDMYYLIHIVIYVAFYFIFARRMPVRGELGTDIKTSLGSGVLLLLITVVLSVTVQVEMIRNYEHLTKTMVCVSFVYAMACCFFFLWVQLSQRKALRLQRELDVQRMMMSTREEQYRQSRANIELLNWLCQGAKGQPDSAIDEAVASDPKERFQRELEAFGSTSGTQNPVLDTILTEKRIYNDANGITWLCAADGREAGFISTTDLYTMLGNALDNAVECVSELSDPRKRLIEVKVFTKGRLLMIQVKNYYEGILQFEDELPVPTKKDRAFRGYGLPMIRQIAEKYGGYMTVQTGDQIFSLQIMIPLPAEQ